MEIPDREALGLGSHLEAAKGAYVLREYKKGQPEQGCIFVQGTMSTYNLIRALKEIDAAGVNVKIVATPSPQLFRMQSGSYRDEVITAADRMNSTFITNGAKRLMHDWTFNPLAEQYCLSSDWDDDWRLGGSLDEVCEDAHIDTESIAKGVVRFAQDYDSRMKRLRAMMDAASA